LVNQTTHHLVVQKSRPFSLEVNVHKISSGSLKGNTEWFQQNCWFWWYNK